MSPADKTKQFIKEAPLVTDALARHFVRYTSTLGPNVQEQFCKSTLDVLSKGFVEVDNPVK